MHHRSPRYRLANVSKETCTTTPNNVLQLTRKFSFRHARRVDCSRVGMQYQCHTPAAPMSAAERDADTRRNDARIHSTTIDLDDEFGRYASFLDDADVDFCKRPRGEQLIRLWRKQRKHDKRSLYRRDRVRLRDQGLPAIDLVQAARNVALYERALCLHRNSGPKATVCRLHGTGTGTGDSAAAAAVASPTAAAAAAATSSSASSVVRHKRRCEHSLRRQHPFVPTQATVLSVLPSARYSTAMANGAIGIDGPGAPAVSRRMHDFAMPLLPHHAAALHDDHAGCARERVCATAAAGVLRGARRVEREVRLADAQRRKRVGAPPRIDNGGDDGDECSENESESDDDTVNLCACLFACQCDGVAVRTRSRAEAASTPARGAVGWFTEHSRGGAAIDEEPWTWALAPPSWSSSQFDTATPGAAAATAGAAVCACDTAAVAACPTDGGVDHFDDYVQRFADAAAFYEDDVHFDVPKASPLAFASTANRGLGGVSTYAGAHAAAANSALNIANAGVRAVAAAAAATNGGGGADNTAAAAAAVGVVQAPMSTSTLSPNGDGDDGGGGSGGGGGGSGGGGGGSGRKRKRSAKGESLLTQADETYTSLEAWLDDDGMTEREREVEARRVKRHRNPDAGSWRDGGSGRAPKKKKATPREKKAGSVEKRRSQSRRPVDEAPVILTGKRVRKAKVNDDFMNVDDYVLECDQFAATSAKSRRKPRASKPAAAQPPAPQLAVAAAATAAPAAAAAAPTATDVPSAVAASPLTPPPAASDI
jgi:hypothetical protein